MAVSSLYPYVVFRDQGRDEILWQVTEHGEDSYGNGWDLCESRSTDTLMRLRRNVLMKGTARRIVCDVCGAFKDSTTGEGVQDMKIAKFIGEHRHPGHQVRLPIS